MKNIRASFCVVILVAAFLCASARADTDPADKATAENRLTSGSWTISFQKGWSIVRIFAKDGTFWTPNRPDESGHWVISNNSIVQTYSSGDEREDVLTLPVAADTITGTARDGETMSAVHDKAVPAAVPAPALTVQQKAAVAVLLMSGRWEITELDWTSPHYCYFRKDGRWLAEGRPSQQGQWTIGENIITLTFRDGHKDYLLLPLDPKGTGYTDENGAPGKAVLPTPAAVGTPASSVATVPAQAAQPQAPATPRDLLLSGPWKISTKTRSDLRVFMKDGTFKTLNAPEAKGQWEMTNDFVIMLFPGGHKDAIYMPLNPKGSSGLADNGDAITATLENSATGDSQPSPSGATATVAPAREKAVAADLLVSAPWTISGQGDGASFRTRTFAKDGTFSTSGHDDEYGWWKIVNNIIILTFADEHKESLKLPWDPKGTSGLDKDGAPISAVQQKPVAGAK